MKITLLGDLVPSAKVKFNFELNTSLLIFNLEAPIVSEGNIAVSKAGPHLSSQKLTFPEISTGAQVVANLSNNHIMDYGTGGLTNTISECDKNRVRLVGAGQNSEVARTPLILSVEGKKVGIIGCCEQQFGSSTTSRAGVACVGPWVYSQIKDLKTKVDLIIITIHGASEDTSWPSPKWQELLKSFIDAGAGIVHGHHSHVPQGFEEYNGGLIFYGLGNFVVDPKKWHDSPNTLWSIMPEIHIVDDEFKYDINVCTISEDENDSIVINKAVLGNSGVHYQYLDLCNRPLKDEKLLNALWQEVTVRMYGLYYAKYLNFPEGKSQVEQVSVRGRAKYFLAAIQGKIIGNTRSTKSQLLLWYHLFACETHHEALSTALGVLGGEIEDLRTEETKSIVDHILPMPNQLIS